MLPAKKSIKSKFISDDLDELVNDSQFIKYSPKCKKTQKRQIPETEDKHISIPGSSISVKPKKRKTDENVENCRESRQKLLNVMSHQIETRKNTNENFMRSLSEIITHFEADYDALKDNEQKLEHLTGAFKKCMQQTTNAHKLKIKALKESYTSFKKECEQMEADHISETNKLGQELEDDIKKLQEKLVTETKRHGWENLQRTILQAMQNDF
ncbi:synaptonemal complex protein 3-like [Battus philenor]|uniref:synaptonemal complex protein 3-like n=1 Tax=Battus philenor TaxID=42288 RepID=UPI0035CF0573